ncbi:hypothetical protein IJ818_08365 [bacterium]|nr:hypothetical protein [bacterium]
MQEYLYIREKLETFNIENRLLKLSKEFENKKVAILGANEAFKAIDEKYDLKSYFNIVGISDGNQQNIESVEQSDIRFISVENLYFSGIDVLLNFKDCGEKIEKYLRKNHLIKKKVKFINLLEKSFLEKLSDILNISKEAFITYRKTGQIMPVFDSVINYEDGAILSHFNYQKKASQLIEKADKQIRVLFVVFDYRQWYLNNLYFKLRADNNFKVLPIIVLPNALGDREAVFTDETLKYFRDNGYNCLDGIEHDTNQAVMIKALKPDIIFYQQIDYLKSDYSPKNLSEYALTCFVEPEFSFKKQCDMNNFTRDRLDNTWKIYASNRESMKTFKNSVNAGFTLYEKYRANTVSENDWFWSSSDKSAHNRIVYSPSFDVKKYADALDFIEYQKNMLDYVLTHPQYSFVFIPDKNLQKQCIENNVLSTEEFVDYINRWSVLPNVVVKDNLDAVSVYKSSDIMLTDSFLTAIDYFPCGKPVILIGNNNDIELNDIGEKIFKTLYKLPSIEALDIVLEDLLIAQNDYSSKERFSVLGKYNDYFNQESSDIIINDLKSSLELNSDLEEKENSEHEDNLKDENSLSEDNIEPKTDL